MEHCNDESGTSTTVAPDKNPVLNQMIVTDGCVVHKPETNPVTFSEEQPTMVTGHTQQPPWSAENAPTTAASDPHTPVHPVQLDNWETGKAGIAFICVSAGCPDSKDYIADCIAGDKMEECLGTKLGYHTIHVKNMTSEDLDDLLCQIEQSTLPASYRRAIFYFFGHGNATSVRMADGAYIERCHIAKTFHSICPPDSDVTKTIIFESCRLEGGVTCRAVQETSIKPLTVSDCSKAGGPYPVLKNTLIIDATNFDNEAHYRNGCGLFTRHFTELAPTLNVSLYELLLKVRKAVIDETPPDRVHKEQLLDFKDMLIRSVCLLAESQGTARVTATDVCAMPSALDTSIEWRYDNKVEDRIEGFDVEVSPTRAHVKELITLQRGRSARQVTLPDLESAVEYGVTVITKYCDGMKARSDTRTFISPARLHILDVQLWKTSATVMYADTAMAKHKWLQYSLRHSGQSGGKFIDFEPPYFFSVCHSGDSVSSVEQQYSQRNIHNMLSPGKKYLIKLRAEYNIGGSTLQRESEEFAFCTPPSTAFQKTRWCFCLSTRHMFLLLLLLTGLFMITSCGVYIFKLHHGTQCQTHYILMNSSIECESANSLHYGTITVNRSVQMDDIILGIMQAWLVKKTELKFYSEPQNPVISRGSATDHEQVLLNGWQTYTWKNSKIHGQCCIVNNGTTEQTASLYIFTRYEDIMYYLLGKGERNVILFDDIKVPPGREQCFSKWGIDAPYTVHHNSYHFIGVDVPPNSSFSSNITVLQMTINPNDYGEPQYFIFDTGTTFTLSERPFSSTDYTVICQALSSLKAVYLYSPTDNGLGTLPKSYFASKEKFFGLHVYSCKEPHGWMVTTVISLFGGGLVCLWCFFVCCRWCRYCSSKK